MSSSSSSVWKSIRRWLPGFFITLVALYVVFKLASWKELGAAFAAMRLWNIVAVVGLTIVFVLFRGIAWRFLLRGRATVSQTFFGINVGYLLNNLFPLRAGEIGRSILLGKESGLGTFHVLSTVVIERVFDLMIAAALLLATLPLALGMDWVRPVAYITLALVAVGMGLMFWMARNRLKVATWIEKVGSRRNFVERYIVPQVESLLDGLAVLTSPLAFAGSLGFILLSWLAAVTEYYLMILPIAPHAPFWWGIFVDTILAMGIAIPSAPAALGVFEASIVAALALLGVASSPALATAVIIHFLQFVTTGVLGLIGLVREGRSITSLFAETQTNQNRKVEPVKME